MKRKHEESEDDGDYLEDEEDMEIPEYVQEACDHFVQELEGYLQEARVAIEDLKITCDKIKTQVIQDFEKAREGFPEVVIPPGFKEVEDKPSTLYSGWAGRCCPDCNFHVCGDEHNCKCDHDIE